mgnify:CR=1 FL=1|tara:strand:- start:1129 stop:1446 length:318 start_codon:yes stop_codon:yes gene_type:complete
MRKITEESINAFLNRTKFKKQNMEVTIYNDKTCLWLHGNCIATLENNELFITNCGWESNTTKERLNGLINEYLGFPNCIGKGIYQKNFQWFLNGELWNGELTKIK